MGVTIEIGGNRVRFDSAGPDLRIDASGPLERFSSADARVDVEIVATPVASLEPPDGELVFDAGDVWTLHRRADELVFSFYARPLLGNQPYRILRFRPEEGSGELLVRRIDPDGPVTTDVADVPLLELLYVHSLLAGRGVDVHAAGLVTPAGRGLLVCGQSGDGKTTMSRLWSASRVGPVLSDDRILVCRDADGFRMWGTPWHGEGQFAENLSAPVAAVLFPARGTEPSLEPVAAERAAALLVARCFPPFHDPVQLGFIMELFGELACSLPCFLFRFPKDERAPAALLERF